MDAIFLLACIFSATLVTSTDPSPEFLLMQLTNLELTLAGVQSQLDQTTTEQQATAQELTSIKAELRIAQAYIDTLENKVKVVQTDYNVTLTENMAINAELNALKEKVKISESDLNATKLEVSGLKGGQGHNGVSTNEVTDLKNLIDQRHDDYVTLHAEVEMLKTDTRLTGQDIGVVRFEAEENKKELEKLQAEFSQMKTSGVSGATPVDNGRLLSFNASLKATNAEVSVLSNKLASTTFDVNSALTQIGNLQSKVDTMETNVTAELGHLQGHLMTSSNPDKGQVDTISTSVKDITTRLSALENSVSQDSAAISSIEADFQNWQQNVSTCQATLRDIGYEVRLHMDMMTVRMGDKLVFERTLFNKGGGYDNKTGIFTAPVTGSYIFWAQITIAQKNSMLSLHFEKNGVALAKSFIETPDDRTYGILSLTTVAHLDKGDFAWFQKSEGSDNFYGRMYSGYGGVLVSS